VDYHWTKVGACSVD